MRIEIERPIEFGGLMVVRLSKRVGNRVAASFVGIPGDKEGDRSFIASKVRDARAKLIELASNDKEDL